MSTIPSSLPPANLPVRCRCGHRVSSHKPGGACTTSGCPCPQAQGPGIPSQQVPAGGGSGDASSSSSSKCGCTHPLARHNAQVGCTDRRCECRVGIPKRRLKATNLALIQPKRVRWVWEGRLPAGELTFLAGREGQGKSLWQAHFAAQLTNGTLPGEFYGTPRTVLFVATEDDYERTVVPRLMAAGATLHRCWRVDAVEGDDTRLRRLVLPLDLDELGDVIRAKNAAAVFLDPLASALDGGLDSHKDTEIRQALDPLAALAHETGVLINALVHFGKTQHTDVMNAVLGSRAFSATARAVLAVGKQPARTDDSTEAGTDAADTYVLSVEKNNLGSTNWPGIGYRIEPMPLLAEDGPTTTARIVETGDCAYRVRDLFMPLVAPKRQPGPKLEEARKFLRGCLADGMRKKEDVEAAAEGWSNISPATLRRAKKEEGIESVQPGGVGTPWFWTYPAEAAPLGGDTDPDPKARESAPDLSQLPRPREDTCTDEHLDTNDLPAPPPTSTNTQHQSGAQGLSTWDEHVGDLSIWQEDQSGPSDQDGNDLASQVLIPAPHPPDAQPLSTWGTEPVSAGQNACPEVVTVQVLTGVSLLGGSDESPDKPDTAELTALPAQPETAVPTT